MTNSSRGFVNIIVLIIVVLALGGVVGYAALQNKSYFESAYQAPTPTSANSAVNFHISPTSGAVPLTVSIISSKGDYGLPGSLDFGDSSGGILDFTVRSGYCSPSNCSTEHTYTKPGVYEVRLIDADMNDHCDEATKAVCDAWIKAHILGSATLTVTDNSSGMSKYTDSDFGFSFQYPSVWQVTGVEKVQEGNFGYQYLARVINPARSGKADTDTPSEHFFVERFNSPCKWGKATTFAGKAALDTAWETNNMAGEPTRTVCIQTSGWPIYLEASALDETSKSIMDQIFSSFTFTK